MRIDIISRQFGRAYETAKLAQSEKQEKQALFFEACTQEAANNILARFLVPITDENSADPVAYVQLYHPGYRYLGQSASHLIVEEDPELVKFSWVDKKNGMVYGRTVVDGGTRLDDERLRLEDKDLWEVVSGWPEPFYSLLKDALLPVDDEVSDRLGLGLEDYIDQVFSAKGFARALTDPANWSKEQLDKVQRYMIPGALTVRLVAPRKATEEELEAGT